MKDILPSDYTQHDAWQSLKQYTLARIALGRTGHSIPLNESLNFKMAHAHARDAVYATLDKQTITDRLQATGLDVIAVKSEASSREEYLKRPDKGRRLDFESATWMKNHLHNYNYDVVFVIADGLSARATNSHAVPVLAEMLKALRPRFRIAPIILAEQGRVAIGDDIGFICRASVTVILIGERPGLSSPDSLGAYLTYNPKPGLTDESRNCVSNIRPVGLPYEKASEKICTLIRASMVKEISGVMLKDDGLA